MKKQIRNEKMKLKDVRKRLNELCPKFEHGYGLFSGLFKDEKYKQRRSFNDLFVYFRKYGVTEKMLMKALKREKFEFWYCNTINRNVFYKPWQFLYFYNDRYEDFRQRHIEENRVNTGKYTKEYLLELYNKVK